MDIPVFSTDGTQIGIVHLPDYTSEFWIQLGTLIATWALVGVTIWYMRRSNKNTELSNNLMKQELKARIRPIIARTVIGESIKKEQDGSKIHDAVFALKREKALFHFANIGTLPAVKITCSWFVCLKEGDNFVDYRTSDKKADSELGVSLPSIAPNERYSIDLFFDEIHYNSARYSNKCFFGLEINYQDPQGTGYYYRMEGHFDKEYLFLDKVELD